jgi:hypothetical protein
VTGTSRRLATLDAVTADSDLDSFLRQSLASAGVTVRPDALALLRLLHGAFATGFEALNDADLAAVPLEWDLDPSRAPRT